MKERTFQFDSIIAICALLISCLAVITSVYQTWVFRDQTRVIHDQYAAAIWPYIGIDDTTDTTGSGAAAKLKSIDISLVNNGLGPALIRDAQLFVDGHSVADWNELRDLFAREESRAGGKVTQARLSSVSASTTIRPGDSDKAFYVAVSSPIPVQQLLQHDVRINLCYCSLNGQCWVLHHDVARPSRRFPVPVDQCETTHRIESLST